MKSRKKRTVPHGALYKNVVNLWEALPQDKTDPLGSYTGRPEKTEQPEQDADDL